MILIKFYFKNIFSIQKIQITALITQYLEFKLFSMINPNQVSLHTI